MELSLIFKSPTHFSADKAVFVNQDGLVDEIGYKDLDDDDLDWLLGEKDYQEGAHFVMRLDDDQYVRIGAKDMIAQIRPLHPSRLPR